MAARKNKGGSADLLLRLLSFINPLIGIGGIEVELSEEQREHFGIASWPVSIVAVKTTSRQGIRNGETFV